MSSRDSIATLRRRRTQRVKWLMALLTVPCMLALTLAALQVPTAASGGAASASLLAPAASPSPTPNASPTPSPTPTAPAGALDLTPYWRYFEGNNVSAVAWGDMDGDGYLDLVIGTAEALRVFHNNHGELGATPVFTLTGIGGVLSVAWGDIDADGYLDLAVGTGVVRVYRNIAGPPGGPERTFERMPWTPAVEDARDGIFSSAWGDMNGDGRPDLAVGAGWHVRVYQNLGGYLDSNAVKDIQETERVNSVAWGDLDADGKLDLAVGVGYFAQTSGVAHVYRNQGDNLSSTPVFTVATRPVMSVAWGDMDGDGRLDLAVGTGGPGAQSSFAAGTISVYRNTGGALTSAAAWQAIDLYDHVWRAVWGDVDGDGRLDLVVGAQHGVQVYLNQGVLLAARSDWRASDYQDGFLGLALGDVDGDGSLDLAAGTDDGTRLYRNESDTLSHIPATPLGIAERSETTGGADTAGGDAPDSLQWNAFELNAAYSGIAWGDVDRDGDLDLASVVNDRVRIYKNQNGTLTTTSSSDVVLNSRIWAVAWGDVDRDGMLDLAIGTDSGVKVYHNLNGVLSNSGWSSADYGGPALGLAWGDLDGDGYLDLAVGTNSGVRVYPNQSGSLATTAIYSSTESNLVKSVAWGDVDGDGNLDLAAGFAGINEPHLGVEGALLYHNDRSLLNRSAMWWVRGVGGRVHSVAWGDMDGDGKPDLAVGSWNGVAVYTNLGGTLTTAPTWQQSDFGGQVNSVAWGDVHGTGELDLAVGTNSVGDLSHGVRVYRTQGGRFAEDAAWTSLLAPNVNSVAWGDLDGDGALDLAALSSGAVKLYHNTRNLRYDLPKGKIARPGLPPNLAADADFYSAPQILEGPVISFTFKLADPHGMPAARVIGQYSLDGGGAWRTWRPAVATPGTRTTNLGPGTYSYGWDISRSGIMGQSDNVVFRLIILPTLTPGRNQAVGPFLYGSYSTTTFPFRVRGTQVRVYRGTVAAGHEARGALVYRLREGQQFGAEPFTDQAGAVYRTNAQGYLQGRGTLNLNDRLVALLPINATGDISYTLYNTSASPTVTGLDARPVLGYGTQTLVVSDTLPLILFNLRVSLEWDPRADTQFIAQLSRDLKRTSEILYDWTNGQAALGQLSLYYNKERWDEADIRIYASNRVRPNAAQGGIVTHVTADGAAPSIQYRPGQVRMGAVWNRYGEATANLGEDWPRTLAHELAHYAFFLDDDYLGVDPTTGLLVPLPLRRDTPECPSAMTDPYRDDYYTEFHPDAGWREQCRDTLANHATGRSDWATIKTFYPMLNAPEPTRLITDVNPGPNILPLDVTHIAIGTTANGSASAQSVSAEQHPLLNVPLFFLTQADGALRGERVVPSQYTRAFLFRSLQPDGGFTTLIDLGRPTLDQVQARGARVGDWVCVEEPPAHRMGCTMATTGNESIPVFSDLSWEPEITVSVVTSRTIDLTVSGVPSGLALKGQLYSAGGDATRSVTLAARPDGRYTYTFGPDDLARPSFEGYVRIWAADASWERGDPSVRRRQIVTDYAVGGNPGSVWSDNAPRGNTGSVWSDNAPVISSDGQVFLYGEESQFADGQFASLQAATHVPFVPPWMNLVGQAYRLTANNSSVINGRLSVVFNYMTSNVPAGQEPWIKMLFLPDGSTGWRPLDDMKLDTYHNVASARTQGTGLYALMTSVEVRLHGPGWNLFGYPVHDPATDSQGRPITITWQLKSIAGQFRTVYGYNPRASDPWLAWQVYDTNAPCWVNDLERLEFGFGYWINVTAPTTVTLRLRGDTVEAGGTVAHVVTKVDGVGIDSWAETQADAAPLASPYASSTDLTTIGDAIGANPPATFYGRVLSDPHFTARAGLLVRAKIDGKLCGQGATFMAGGQVVYKVSVFADDGDNASGCGRPGRTVTFEVGAQPMTTTAVWNNSQVWELPLGGDASNRLYLPLIRR